MAVQVGLCYKNSVDCLPKAESEMLKFLAIWAALAFTVFMTYGPALAKFVSY